MSKEEGDARLLIVEDDEMSRDMLTRRLRRRGYTVEAEPDGARALQRLTAEPFDLVLLDWMMPGMTGLEVLTHLRELHSPNELPVIMVTAKAESADVVRALDLGANDYVTKPVDLTVVLARIRTQLTLQRSQRQLQKAATRDALTGLFNRRALAKSLTDMVASSRRYGHPLACCMWDLDHYKQVNDRHGHATGDEVLRQVGALLTQELRDTDVAARYGGDEFVMALPHTGAEGAQQLVARVRARLRALSFVGPNGAFSVTGSFGLAVWTPGQSATELLEAADRALYRAKADGRDCTRLAA